MIHNSFPSMKPNIDKNFGEGNSMMGSYGYGSYGWWHFQVLNAASGWNSHGVEQLCLHLLPAHGDIQVRTQSASSVWSACRSGEKGLGMAALLATYGTLFTILYLAWPHPILHQVHKSVRIQALINLQVMYGVLVFYMIYQAVMILKEGFNKVSMKWVECGKFPQD